MSKDDPLDTFLDAVALVRGTGAGTRETSYYPALDRTFDVVGSKLTPRVIALNHPTGKQAGIPDFGFFVSAKGRRAPPPDWQAGALPDRGVAEVKGLAQDIDALCQSAQVAKYAGTYGLVLCTNLRQWRLMEQGAGGTLKCRDRCDVAASEAAFHALVQGSRPNTLRQRFAGFVERCLLARAPVAKPEDLARLLASYAREALTRLAEQATLPALQSLRSAMESALGMQFDAKDGEHLFRSTLVQTLFYGVFSAWAAHVREHATPFAWRQADWSLHVPVMQFLFQQVARPQALQPLGLAPLLDAAEDTLAHVDRTAFFAAFAEAAAVQYFYEPFLRYFDPALQDALGVWYTPPEIVTYMVERVDRVLRSELGIADGLADERVWVLDPCCGTGSFVVAVLDRIRATLQGKGLGDLLGERLKRAATTRIVGFEIMTAPFVIAHWQVGEAMARVQAPLAPGERAAIYLTNALTGWQEAAQPPIPGFEVLSDEGAGASAVKRDKPILVVLGNPPYNAFAGTSSAAEGGLVDAYKAGLNTTWGVKKFNLDDLYVRFFRIAERRIAEQTGSGVVCYISNSSWLAGASFVVMRERLLREFDAIWIDNLNGDSRETGKLTPDGAPDPSVFSTAFNREGIRVGTAIATMVRKAR